MNDSRVNKVLKFEGAGWAGAAMRKTYEKQLLIEAETKLEALEARMDYMLSECATQEELRPYQESWDFLMDYINDLKKELSEVQS